MSLAIPTLLAVTLLAPPVELRPYFESDPAWEPVYRALHRERTGRAERLLRARLAEAPDEATKRRAAFLLSEVLETRASRTRKARQRAELRAERTTLLESLTDYAPLAGRIRASLAELAMADGDPKRARAHWSAIPEGCAQWVPSRLSLARLAIVEERSAHAEAMLEAVAGARPTRSERGELSLLRARARAQTDARKEAVAALKSVWAREYPNKRSEQALEALRELKALPSATERATLAFATLRRAKGKALEKKLKVATRKYRRKARLAVEFARGVTEFFDKKRRKRALVRFKRAARATNPLLRGYAHWWWAKTLRRLGRDGEAVEKYLALVEKVPRHPKAAEALLEAAGLRRAGGDEAGARALVERLVAEYRDHPRRAEVLWTRAWDARKRGDPARARDLLARLAKREGAGRHLGQATWEERAVYWRGRCEAELGQGARAAASWEYLVRRFPLTYYSHQAYNRLTEMDPQRALMLRPHREVRAWSRTTLADLGALRLSPTPALEGPAELVRLGLYDDARSTLRAQARRGALGSDGLTLLLSLGLRQGRYKESHSVIRWRGTLPRYPDEADARLWQLAYPLPYWDTLREVGSRYKVSPYFALSVIRHESAYEPEVVSRANAIGLMQLLPATAGQVARRLLNAPRPSRRALKRPQTNIRLGTRLLRAHLHHFSNNPALVLAAYNAGSGRARRWWREFRASGRDATDELLEEIPFDETHSYVKSILATWGVYRYLYGDRSDAGMRTIPVPARLPEELGPYFDPKI